MMISLSQMCPIGKAQCSVMDIVKAPGQCCKLDIQFDNATCGYLHIRAWKVSDRGGEDGRKERKGRGVHSFLHHLVGDQRRAGWPGAVFCPPHSKVPLTRPPPSHGGGGT